MSNLMVRPADDLRWCAQCHDDRAVELLELPDAEPESVPVCVDCGSAVG